MTDGGAAIVTNMAVVRSILRYFVSVFVNCVRWCTLVLRMFFLIWRQYPHLSVLGKGRESKKCHQSGFICSVPENLSIHALCL
jgi:hypothetical protein